MITGALMGVGAMSIVIGPFAIWVWLFHKFDLTFGQVVFGVFVTYGGLIGALVGAPKP